MSVYRDQLVSRERIIRAMRHQRPVRVLRLFLVAPRLCVSPSAHHCSSLNRPTRRAIRSLTSADVIAAGRVVFDQACQSCHAPGGTGDRGPALNTGVFRHGSEDGDLFRTIREGCLEPRCRRSAD